MSRPIYKRILLKLSGEAMMGTQGLGIDPQVVNAVALELKEVKELGVEIGLIIGGGNIFRGLSASARGMDRVTADYMGMLATVINALARFGAEYGFDCDIIDDIAIKVENVKTADNEM